ncbi:methyltransferase domain-containing protein [Streptomyces sp. NBC_01237]|uniref:methyltransferase domain-containing protein n=1 Tax=Streptomyces sp. NBC_01237 TaxID=2903790 RepID=UPI002DD852DE|nr:methyltransferase domain-containing protein [Streptomyces sp. NBC_01237]WRZ73014.1 methyltransferase domain-containing protein [Streptomyces sp. NBC_01237]
MTTPNLATSEQIAIRDLLGSVNHGMDTPLRPEWERAAWSVTRSAFIPERVYLGDQLEPCDRANDPEAWLRAVYADDSVVTQINDGEEPTDGDRWASSSASAPSIVFRMLHMLDVAPEQRVLEIGTGTGWNAGLLAYVAGSENVTTVEVDPVLASKAQERLRKSGLGVEVIAGDGAMGHADGAPYDRLVATCSVRSVPRPWLTQVKPGGVILAPWESPWICYGLLRMTVDDDGTASGRFSPHSAFMLMRQQRTNLRIFRDVVRDDHQPDESTTNLPPWQVTGDELAARFAMGLQLRDVWWTWHDNPYVEGVVSRLWLATTDATSWAAVDWDGKSDTQWTVWQQGRRRLWREVEAAHDWWALHDRPGPERFGLTVTASGGTPWLDTPEKRVPTSG